MAESRPASPRIRALRHGAAVLFALLLFYGVPVDRWPGTSLAGVVATVAFVIGVLGLLWLVARQIRRYLDAPEGTDRRVDGILLLLVVVIVFFAQFYYRLEVHDPAQFDGLRTRTDALYYTIVTLGTVGFGDVQASGQAARIAVMIQIVFDLIVIGTLLAVMTTSIVRRVEAGRRTADGGPGATGDRAEDDGRE
ncbi:potassium channel family protein [Nocardia higoensis]|uniref:potassium channel family protein n=1 Tax=Nocardia higoensis TaxID=228599 RepID=UPI0002E09110|nr:potassium channel family protein [Nocardia higoensis]